MISNIFKYRIRSIIIIFFLSSSLMSCLILNPEIQTSKAASSWTQTSDIDFNSGTFNNTTIIGTDKDAELRINVSNINEWTKKEPITDPGTRAWHAMASVFNDDKVVLFGGRFEYNPIQRNDTWVYDLSNNTWINRTPVNGPSRRQGHAMATIYGKDEVLLFGGFYGSGSPPYYNDTWVYNLSNNTWTKKIMTSQPKGVGHAMASVHGTDKVVLFGGTKKIPDYLDETWIYDSSIDIWINRTPSITPPSYPKGRFGHAMASIYGDDKVVLFGGLTNAPSYSDETWVYDLSENSWTNKTTIYEPPPRWCHAMASIHGDDKVILFGGNDGGNLGWRVWWDDTWVYDLSDNTWTKIIPRFSPNKPSGIDCPVLALIYGTDKVLLYGGVKNNTISYFHNDTWVYKQNLPTKNGTYVSKPYDTGANSSFQIISWSATLLENTSIKLQLKTGSNESNLDFMDFLGPDGTSKTYYTSSPSDIWSGHHGDRWVQYKAFLNISVFSGSPALRDVTITYNCLPITIAIGPKNGSLLTDNKPTFQWIFEDHDSIKQKAFQVLIDIDINFESITFDSGEQITTKQHWDFPLGTNYTELPDGSWYWKVRTMDPDGAWTDFSQPWMLSIDTKPPNSAIISPINNGFYNGIPNISGIANDVEPGSGVKRVEIAINRFSDNNFWDGNTWVTLKQWLLAYGNTNWTYNASSIQWHTGIRYNIQSRAIDNANHTEQSDKKNIFSIDIENPQSIINIPEDNTWVNELKMISGTSMDFGGSGIDKVEISIKCIKDDAISNDGPKEKDYWDGQKWTSVETWLLTNGTNQWTFETNLIPLSLGDHYRICSRSIDNIGNSEESFFETTFMYDDKPPEKLAIYINNGEDYTNNTNVYLSLQGVDIGSGIAQMSFSTDGIGWSGWEPFNTSYQIQLQSSDTQKTVYFMLKDYVDNIAEPVFDTIILDTTPPQKLSIEINNGDKYTNSRYVELKLDAIDIVSGLDDMCISYNSIDWLSWEPFETIRFISVPSSVTYKDGEKNIFFKVRDNIGNIAEPVSDSIILDSTPPHSLSISINKGDQVTTSTLVTIDLNAIDDLSGVDQMSFSMDNETWSSWENYSKIKIYTLPSGNGEKIIYFKVKDNINNTAEPMMDSIILNTDSSPERDQKDDENESNLLIWLIIFIVILIVVIFIVLPVFSKQKKQTKIKESLPGSITIKPLSSPLTELDRNQVSNEQSFGQLPGKGITKDSKQLVASTSAKSPISASPQVPKLVKSTQTIPESIQQKPVSDQTSQLPQLPPSQPETAETKMESVEEPTSTLDKQIDTQKETEQNSQEKN